MALSRLAASAPPRRASLLVRRTRWIVALLVVTALAAGAAWQRLEAKRAMNERIVAGRVLEVIAPAPGASAASQPASADWLNDGRPPQWRFAQASLLAKSGRDEAALARWRSLYDDPELGAAARYNSANLLMRQAIALRESTQPGQAIALIELAKETYRSVLRQRPDDWDARYNLERAQRLQPDPEPADTAPSEPPQDAERAATTMRGVSQGLP
ncbi:hypothetical protein [Caldimonas sp. KR1-144]|uniref:hypothetical protein n=1 Tax=Caldimonas sp. KR1-144 TaxID=3400911 RepID=UPI003C01E0E8